MTGVELDREQLSLSPFILNCPSCHENTQTGYSLWEKKMMEETPELFMEFDCVKCHTHVYYDPLIQEASLTR